MKRRSGKRPLSNVIKMRRGTFKPSRASAETAPPLAGDPVKPNWLPPEAAKIWDAKVAIYRARGVAVRGSEGVLAQYCALEAALIRQWSGGLTPMPSELAQFRIYAGEFFDTPANPVPMSRRHAENPFARYGLGKPSRDGG